MNFKDIVRETDKDGNRVYVDPDREKVEYYTEFLEDAVNLIISRFEGLADLIMVGDSAVQPERIFCLLEVLIRDARRETQKLFESLEGCLGKVKIDRAINRWNLGGGDFLGAFLEPVNGSPETVIPFSRKGGDI